MCGLQMNKIMRDFLFSLLPLLVALFFLSCQQSYPTKEADTMQTHQQGDTLTRTKQQGFKEISHPTPNYSDTSINEVKGIILHHTAEPTAERSLEVLCSNIRRVGTHVVIDTDGTRYIMAEPWKVTYHAGPSILHGREGCNYFTIGIEFQGNTLEMPLTMNQIRSGIEYILPLMQKYNIPLSSIVTHEMVRQAYKAKYPEKKVSGKVDITQEEYWRFMRYLKEELQVPTNTK